MTDENNKLSVPTAPPSLAVGGKKGSLHARVAQRGTALQAKDRLCLLLDVSGSMAGGYYSEDKNASSPIELLKRSVEAFVQTCSEGTALSFHTFPEQRSVPMTLTKALIILESSDLYAGGGTPMAQAMQKALDENPTRCVLISDGGPESAERAFQVADTYVKRVPSLVCDTVHIGHSTNGEEVLRRIAEMTGGVYIKFEDVSKLVGGLKYLTPSYRALLTSGNVDAKQLGAKEVK